MIWLFFSLTTIFVFFNLIKKKIYKSFIKKKMSKKELYIFNTKVKFIFLTNSYKNFYIRKKKIQNHQFLLIDKIINNNYLKYEYKLVFFNKRFLRRIINIKKILIYNENIKINEILNRKLLLIISLYNVYNKFIIKRKSIYIKKNIII